MRSGIAAFSIGTRRDERAARDHEAADVLREVAREADERVHERDELRDHAGSPGSKPGLGEALRQRPAGRPTRRAMSARRSTCAEIEAERLADVAHRALRAVGDDGGGERGAVAAVLRVEVLDHLLAPLVLEVDVDVGRLVALARDEALEQHRHARRIDLGDAEA